MSTKPAVHGQRSGLADALFFGTRSLDVALLFGQSSRSFYATERIGLAASGSGAVQRELASLVASGLVTVNAVGHKEHHQANSESPILVELCGIKQKTVGLAKPLREALAPLAPRIIAAFVHGSVAKKTDTASSDIDPMLSNDVVPRAGICRFTCKPTCKSRNVHSHTPPPVTAFKIATVLLTSCSRSSKAFDNAHKSADQNKDPPPE